MNQTSSSSSTPANTASRHRLHGLLPAPRTQESNPRRGWQRLSLPLAIDREELERLVRASGLTLEAVARTAWLALIARCTGQETIALGVEYTQAQPAAPTHPDTTLALPIKVDQQATLAVLHGLLDREAAQQRQQRSTPTPGIALLFTQSLTRHHPEWPAHWLIGSVRHSTAVELELHYHADTYDAHAVGRLLRDAGAALLTLLRNPDTPIGRLALVDPAPMQALNEAGSPERWAWQGPHDIASVFAEQCRQTPNAPALRFSLRDHSTTELSYRELDAMAAGWALALSRRGAAAGDVIGVTAARGPAAIAQLLGIVRLGAAYLPLDAGFPDERLHSMVVQAQAGLVICRADEVARFDQGIETLTLDDDTLEGLPPADTDSTDSAPLALPRIETTASAYVMFTSGSTGKPKGVAITHQAILRLVCNATYCRLDNTTAMLQAAPLGFDAATLEIWGPLLNGGVCVLYTEPLPTGYDLAATIQTHGANTAWLTATLFNTIVDDEPAHLRGLTQILTGGEALSVAHVRRAQQALPQTTLYNGYGPTESTTFTCTHKIEPLADDASLVPIGQPISATWVAVVNERLQPMPAGMVGELLTGGLGLANGYLNSPDQTRQRFIENPLGEGPAQLYRTGDLVRLNAHGVLEFAGRVDDQVKVRGYRVEPQEIATVINDFANVAQSAVLVENDAVTGIQFHACLVTRDGQDIDEAALRAHLQVQLPDYMLPARVVTVTGLPRTPNGKLDRQALRAQVAAAAAPAAPAAPATPTAPTAPTAPSVAQATTAAPAASPDTPASEAPASADALQTIIAQVFATVLGRDSFAANAHFFDEGGNSLLAIAALDRLRSAHAVRCPVGDLYSFPTPAGLARALATAQTRHGAPLAATAPAQPAAAACEPIAIVGMAARLPGARDLDTFWQNLASGVDAIRRFSRAELDPSLPATLIDDPDYVAARGVIDDADKFDAAFFGIGPREAELLDPQQRVFLELCWSCLETAGYVPDAVSTPDAPVGVFAGMYNATYRQQNLAAHPDRVAQFGEFLVMLGNEKDYIATRTAHRLNLTGPAISIHTACSTSLVAVVQAVDSLLAGQCEMALAGGVSVCCPPASGHLFQDGAMLSRDGSTRTFDADATGTVFSDGAGVVLLKRLSHAQRDGDHIHAIIRGGAVNNDGGGKASFMAPSAAGQAQVVRHALARAGVAPQSISYIEAHGTATPSGDPIEVDGLKQVFGPLPEGATPWCALGSVKSNIGHTVTAAGVAGLIKTTLALEHETIPPTAHFTSLNPAIDLTDSPFTIAARAQPWPRRAGTPRRAGVSAFGVGGTNAHLIVEEAPLSAAVASPVNAPAAQSTSNDQIELLPAESAAASGAAPELPTVLRLSAASPAALMRIANALAEHLTRAGGQPPALADVAHTLAVARKPMRFRTTVVADSIAEAIAQLRQPPAALDTGDNATQRPLVFVFPGQGSQYVAMGSTLAAASPVFNQAWRAAIAAVQEHLDAQTSLLDILLTGTDPQILAQTAVLQPALFCLEYALAKTLIAADLQPAAMIGHSIGEYTAAAIAGVLSLADAARLVVRRGALMQQQPPGAMLSVRLGAQALREMLPPGLNLAADNSPLATVCSGPADAIAAFERALQARAIPCRALHTSHAFHSAMMQPAADAFAADIDAAERHAPQVPIYSTLTGARLSNAEATSTDYWTTQLRAPVLFGPAVTCAASDLQAPIFVELGPRASLSTLIRQCGLGPQTLALAALGDASGEEPASFTALLGRLWASGQDCRAALPTAGRRISLPTYPFEPTRHWLDAAPWTASAPAAPAATAAAGATVTDAPATTSTAAAPASSIHEQLRDLLEQASGLDFEPAHDEVPFAELGLDSLSLTQIALQVKRAFKCDVSFRQLMQDLDSIDRLAEYLQQNGNVSSQAVPGPAPAPAAPATPTQTQARTPGTGRTPAAKAPKAFGAIARIQTNQTELTDDQRQRVNLLIRDYAARTAKSKAYAQQHRSQMADPRVVTGFKPILKEITYPIVTERSAGAYLWDLDGNRYVDALNGFGMNLFGWQPKFVVDAVRRTLDSGYEIGPQHPLAGKVAAQICEMTGAERAALCNTGSEAVMGATRMARTVTGRPKVVVFDGAYHGIFDEVIVRGTRDHRALPAAPGIMPNTSENVISLPYGMPESLQVIRDNADDIAVVLVEPVQSRRPDFQPREFLLELRKITAEQGIVLVFDEVVTGFRTHPAGIQHVFDIKADVTTYGKVIGGGFPIGVIAGKREFMDSLDGGHWQFGDASVPTVGVTYFAGTFVRHPLALAAADAVLNHLQQAGPSLQADLNARTTAFAQELNAFASSVGAPVEVRHFSSFWRITFTAEHLLQELLFPMMRQQGVHILDGFPSFMTTAHTDADIDAIKQAFRRAVVQLQRGRFLPTRDATPGVLFDANRPPVPGARLGRDRNGKPAWFVPNPDAPGKYLRIEDHV